MTIHTSGNHKANWKGAIVLLAVVSLSGCGSTGSGWIYVQQDMKESREAYKTCLAEKGSAEDCEAEKLMYEADVESYKALRGETTQNVKVVE